jgi:hypothetical protein
MAWVIVTVAVKTDSEFQAPVKIPYSEFYVWMFEASMAEYDGNRTASSVSLIWTQQPPPQLIPRGFVLMMFSLLVRSIPDNRFPRDSLA